MYIQRDAASPLKCCRTTSSRAIPEHQLDPVGPLGAEHVDRAGEGVGAHRLAHQGRQTFGALAEVDRPGRHHHPDRTLRADHDEPFTDDFSAPLRARAKR